MDMYKVPGPLSPLAYSMLGLQGGTMLMLGTYLGVLAAGYSAAQAFAGAFTANALFALKWALTEADALAAPKAAPLGWAIASSVLAAMAVM